MFFLLLLMLPQYLFAQKDLTQEKTVELNQVYNYCEQNLYQFSSSLLKAIEMNQLMVFKDSSLQILMNKHENPIKNQFYSSVSIIDSFCVLPNYTVVYLNRFDTCSLIFISSKAFIKKAKKYFIIDSIVAENRGKFISEKSIRLYIKGKALLVSKKLAELRRDVYQCEFFDGDSLPLRYEFCYPAHIFGFYTLYQKNVRKGKVYINIKMVGLNTFPKSSLNSIAKVKEKLTKFEYEFLLFAIRESF